MKAEPSFHKASIRLATCHMRLGDAPAARAALEADPRLTAHPDVAAKLAEIDAHGRRISAVSVLVLPGLCQKLCVLNGTALSVMPILELQ